MESFGFLLQGFATAVTPMNLLLALLGVIIGTAVGVLPGIGPAMTVALLLPVTYNLEPTSAMIMLAGIFYGGMYGGSTTSILLNTPGESSSVVTAIEGNLMAKSGRAAQASGDRRVGLVRGRHHRHPAAGLHRAVRHALRHLAGRTGVLRGDDAGLHRRDLGARCVPVARLHLALHGADHRPDRHRRGQRSGPPDLRHPPTRRRHRRRRRGGRYLRRR